MKEFRVQKVRDQCGDKHLHERSNGVRVNCMHYPMYTFSENVQRSAADPDLASLGSQSCEERERERESGGGGGLLKGSAHFALQILVYMLAPVAGQAPIAGHGPIAGHEPL